MTVHLVSGDLFENEYKAQALAHGCNCRGAMGAGIAVEFKRRYPFMYLEYKGMCSRKELQLGDVYYWTNSGFTGAGEPDVFNIMIKDDWRQQAQINSIFIGLKRMKELADEQEIRSIAIPRIGAGYGGLDWAAIRAIISIVFTSWSGDLYVYESMTKEKHEGEQNESSQ